MSIKLVIAQIKVQLKQLSVMSVAKREMTLIFLWLLFCNIEIQNCISCRLTGHEMLMGLLVFSRLSYFMPVVRNLRQVTDWQIGYSFR